MSFSEFNLSICVTDLACNSASSCYKFWYWLMDGFTNLNKLKIRFCNIIIKLFVIRINHTLSFLVYIKNLIIICIYSFTIERVQIVYPIRMAFIYWFIHLTSHTCSNHLFASYICQFSELLVHLTNWQFFFIFISIFYSVRKALTKARLELTNLFFL